MLSTTLVFTSYCCRSVRALTDYLKYLDNDHLAYNSMLTWKHEYEMYERWPLCSLCEKLHRWVLLVWQEVVDLISDANSWVLYSVNYVNINYSVKCSTVSCKHLLFLQYFFFRLKPKTCKICHYSWCLKTSGNKTNWVIWQETDRKLIDGLKRLS